jgi:hypothetical protein
MEIAKQLELFRAYKTLQSAPAPCDPHVVEQDKPRLTGQNQVILLRLRQGPATNVELADLALKYSGRISDLRAAGYTIICHRGERGLNIYQLKE